MFRRTRRRRRTWRRLLISLAAGACVVVALLLGPEALEAAGGHRAIPYFLGALLVCWLIARKRPSRGSRAPARLARPRQRVSPGIEQLHALSPSEFEVYVRDLFSALGFRELRLNGGAGDLGVDIWGRTPQGMTAVIQCKRYAPGRKVGSPLIQTFIGMQRVHHGADVGLFVTTGGFTLDAMKLAQVHGIQLIDGRTLLKLQKQAGMHKRRRFGLLRR
jgi:restriction system protein